MQVARLSSLQRFFHRTVFLIISVMLLSSVRQAEAQAAEYSGKGKLHVEIADDFKRGTSKTHFFFIPEKSKKRIKLSFKGKAPEGLISGQKIKIKKGKKDNDKITVSALDGSFSTTEGVLTAAVTASPRKVVALRLNYTDATVPCSETQVANYVWFGQYSADKVLQETSYGQIYLPSDSNGDGATDIYTLNVPAAVGTTCSYSTWASQGNTAAANAGIDLSQYNHIIYVLPKLSGCTWAGLGDVNGKRVWINGTYCTYQSAYAHEIGHNIGLAHAGKEGQGEYSDWSSFMGNQPNPTQGHSANRAQLGWMGANLVNATQGTYTLTALSVSASDTQVLRIAKPDTAEYYYVSYRATQSNDPALRAEYDQRVSIHRYKGSGYYVTRLLTVLDVGQQFVDSINGLTISVTGKTATTATVSVSAQCAAVAPTVTFSPATQFSGTDRASKNYTVTVKNNDANCEASSFNLSHTVPAGFAGIFDSASLTIAPGATASTNLVVTPSAMAGQGSYAISASAHASNHPGGIANGSYVLDLTAPSTVTGLSASVGRKNIVSLSWSASTDTGGSGLQNYRVLRNGVQIATTTGTSYNDSGLTSGVTYSYAIVAVDKAQNFAVQSNTAQVTIGGSAGGGGGGGGKGRKK